MLAHVEQANTRGANLRSKWFGLSATGVVIRRQIWAYDNRCSSTVAKIARSSGKATRRRCKRPKALRDTRCIRVFSEKVSGATDARPQLARLMKSLEYGDVVVTGLDRLARSTLAPVAHR